MSKTSGIIILIKDKLEGSDVFANYKPKPKIYVSPRDQVSNIYSVQIIPISTEEQLNTYPYLDLTDTIGIYGMIKTTQEIATIGNENKAGIVDFANDIKKALDANHRILGENVKFIDFQSVDYIYDNYPDIICQITTRVKYRQLVGERS
jgi:hypothetical protein